MITEFQLCIDTLRRLGIVFSINWSPTKADWQKIICEAGYVITALACTVIEVDDTELLFSKGKLDCSGEKEFGPSALFMLSRNKASGKIQKRVRYNMGNGKLLPGRGLRAAKRAYPGEFSRKQTHA